MSGVVTITGQVVRNDLVKNYFHDLVNRFFKILPMRENGEESLQTYMRSLRVELIGGKGLIPELKVNSSYLTLMAILEYLIARNSDTVKFARNCRFLIDDPESSEMNAYLLTKPLKVGKTYNGHGIYSFVLQEVVSTDNDNFELGIANYYLHFPKENTSDIVDDKDDSSASDTGKKGWL